MSSLEGYFKKINTFFLSTLYVFIKLSTIKWCLDKTVAQIENGFERG